MKVIANLFSYENGALFLHKNTDRSISCEKNQFFVSIMYRSPVILLFLFHFRGQGCLILLNIVLFIKAVPKEIILLCMSYDIALSLKKNGGWRSNWFNGKISRFFFFLVQDFKEITQNFFRIFFFPWKNNVSNHSAYICMKSTISLIICSKSTKVTSKQCSDAIPTSLICRIKLF